MTFNIAIIIYLLLLLVFLGGVAAIVYHLIHFQMNHNFSTLVMIIFIVGAVIFLLSNVIFAFKVDWAQFNLIFLNV